MSTFFNKTRSTRSIPQKLLSEGKWYLLPVYYVLRTSFLAREGIERSGSYRFADHIYVSKPKGEYGIGVLLDAILLSFPSAKAFRYRYHRMREELEMHMSKSEGETSILYVPSGLAREFFDIDEVAHSLHAEPKKVKLIGLDLDNELVRELSQRAQGTNTSMQFKAGDALVADHYDGPHDLIISTGFLDFLPAVEAEAFFGLVYNALQPGGRFVTSGMQPHPLSEFLMRQFAELNTVYRTKEELASLAHFAGFTEISTSQDSTGLQTVIVATKKS